MNIILGIGIFALGSAFGVGMMCLLSAGKQADKAMEDELREVKQHES